MVRCKRSDHGLTSNLILINNSESKASFPADGGKAPLGTCLTSDVCVHNSGSKASFTADGG